MPQRGLAYQERAQQITGQCASLLQCQKMVFDHLFFFSDKEVYASPYGRYRTSVSERQLDTIFVPAEQYRTSDNIAFDSRHTDTGADIDAYPVADIVTGFSMNTQAFIADILDPYGN
jgi:hypothetical protein